MANKLYEDAIQQLTKKGYSLELVRQLTSGKEAVVYLVRRVDFVAGDDFSDGDLFALKVYKDYVTRSFQQNQAYLAGKHVRRPSERKAMRKRNKFGRRLMHRLWVKREFYMLRKLIDAGADIPEPVEMTNNAILMEFLGSGESPAVLLKDARLTRDAAKKAYERILRNIEIFYECGVVHGDLSEYNILYHDGQVYVIDFPQAVDIRNNPNAEALLERDRENVKRWFEGVGG